ncbi:MAG: undecaprenyl/decaprenyl-phosphate alpha-N-acetylglucosaminyl 1-phosphate transferase [Sphingobacteriales bacterium]|nr:MAG: undecaprenyl/decaprenyl-phosphate alpha-N-acetylglucosaminyl 1-phosphate transferase [Sphingobacteriales bacterium]
MQSEISSLPLIVYAAFGIIATAFAVIVNYLFLRSIKNIGHHNKNANGHDNLVRWAANTKPIIGGFSMFIVFLLSVSSYYLLPFKNTELPPRELFALLSSVSMGFIIGLVDDSFHMLPAFKFVGQIVCALLMISMGVYISIADSYILNVAFTIFWVVGIMNAINMIDNMDGIATIVSLGILACFITIMYLTGGFTDFYTIIFVGAMSALLGFLYFNWHPSKMFMGDSGSQFLGALLAFAGIVLTWQFKSEDSSSLYFPQFILPAIVFALPIIDTTTVFIYRLARKQSPFVGGRDHTTHHLAYCGFSDKSVALIFAIFALFSVVAACFLTQNFVNKPYHLPVIAVIYLVVLFIGIQISYRIGKARHLKKLKE